MAAPIITELPEPPVRSDAPVDFALKADLFLGAFPWLREQINTTAAWVDGQAGTVATHAASAANDAGTASAAGTAATIAAATASAAATSATSAATAAGAAKTAAEAAATRAEDAAQYVEGVVGPLGTAATRNVTTSADDVTPGRVLKVGDVGLPENAAYRALPKAVTTNNTADFNNIIVFGWFKDLLGGAPGARNPNHPDGQTPMATNNGVANYYWCLVGRYDVGGGLFQLAIPYISAANTTRATLKFRMFGGGAWSEWDSLMNSSNHFNLGPTQTTALAALGLSGLSERVTALEAGSTVTDLGAVATSSAQTVVLDVGASKFFSASMQTANTTGALTLNFTNVPSSATAITTWHVEILRGGRKAVVFQLDGVALTPVWAGGAAPTLSAASNARDTLMFYRMPGRSSVYAMLVDSGAV